MNTRSHLFRSVSNLQTVEDKLLYKIYNKKPHTLW